MLRIIISVMLFGILTTIIYMLLKWFDMQTIKKKMVNNKWYNKLSDYLMLVAKKDLLPKKLKWLNPIAIVFSMLVLFLMSFVLFYNYFKITSTAVILSLPISIFPILIIKILLNKEKSQIIKLLPLYAVNIKNHIDEDNNIIYALQRTIVEEPLKKYMNEFKNNISRGMNVMEAFDILKKDVDVKDFTTFINSCEGCYLNGGSFSKVLEHYIKIITKENVHKEASKEKAYSDILTLIIMVVLNVLVIVTFVFTNKEYAQIIRETVLRKNNIKLQCLVIYSYSIFSF